MFEYSGSIDGTLKALFYFFKHGSTYGGNPLGCKVAITALKVRHKFFLKMTVLFIVLFIAPPLILLLVVTHFLSGICQTLLGF